jgi:hypothetical protein
MGIQDDRRYKMATLTQLVDTVAAVEGLEPSAVSLVARYVREAGLITTRGRGGSAARMNLTDAANLLIGVNATTTATNAAETVSTYRELESYEFLTIQDPRTATRYGTLGEAIEQLIDAAGSGELPDAFLHREVDLDLQDAFSRGDVHIDLRFRISDVSASLKIALLPESDVITPAMAEEWVATTPGWHLWFAFYPPKPRRTRLRGPPGKKKNRTKDRIEETRIGYPTLRAVGKLLQPRG